MSQKITRVIILILNRITGKSFLYIKPKLFNQSGGTAVQDENGVWHVGNVYNDNDITYGIAQNGHVESAETKLFHIILTDLKRQSDKFVLYDIGANIGYYGIMAAAKYGALTHSFEPLNEYQKCLSDSIKLNHTETHHYTHQIALSNHTGIEKFTVAGSGSSLEAGFNKDNNLLTIDVKVDCLDNISSQENLPPPQFIKIDVEGHEWAVLEGAQKVLSEARPVIFIELCSSLRDIDRSYVNSHYQNTLNFLSEKNYEIFLIKNETQLELWDDSKSINHAGMFLCLHKTQHEMLKTIISNFFNIIK